MQPFGFKKLFRPEDAAILVYLTVISVTVTIFHRGVAYWWVYALTHAAGAALIIAWVRFADGHRDPVIRFFRHWYIFFILGIFYEQIDAFVLAIHGRFFDQVIYSFELKLLGVHPSVWMERFVSPPLTEVMKIAYNSYYWLVPVLGLSLYMKGDYIPFRRMAFSVSVAFFISYFGFILFPVIGPRYMLSDLYKGPLEGYFVTALQDFIMEKGDITGGCMPSSHVAVALVILLVAWVYRRRMAMVLTPLVTLLAVSTVYNRYHYASDVLAGAAVGVFAFWWGGRVYGKRQEPGARSQETGGKAAIP